MRIAVDAMGGDHAPSTIVEGAVLAAREYGVEIILVGQEERVRAELVKYDDHRNLHITIQHADEVVEMDDVPAKAVRTKRHSSMKIGLDLVKSKEADAFVSAGNTGAVLAYATLTLRPLKGVDRPAIAVQLPSLKGPSILIDAGANVDCKPIQMFQFGIMGHVIAKYILGKEKPRIGVLSIGEEDGKGNEITKSVFQMLQKGHINFIGNVEAKEVYRGEADVIVCDGFTGNIALKISQSMAEMISENLRSVFKTNLRTKLGYWLIKPYLDQKKKSVDYSETGGAPLLGVNGVCIIAHGRSTGKAIKNAINRAKELVDKNINEHIRSDIEENLEGLSTWTRSSFWKHIKNLTFGSDSDPNNHHLSSKKHKSEPLDSEQQ